MSLRRGRILETMRQQEATRVFSLIDRMGKQEEAMEAMAEERRRLAELREEQRRLRQQDRMDNIERMMRAKDFHNASLNEKFAEQDAREAARKAAKRALIESHKQASLEATFQRQELVDRLAKARGMDALLKLSSSLTAGGVGQGSAGTLSLAESAASTREPASQTPGRPRAPKSPRGRAPVVRGRPGSRTVAGARRRGAPVAAATPRGRACDARRERERGSRVIPCAVFIGLVGGSGSN